MKRFAWRDLVFISLIAAISIITKPYVRMPFSWIQTTLGLPVGAFIGGIYMFWPVMVGAIIRRPGAVFLTCLLQGVVAVLTGFTGLLGQMAFFSYLAPGVVIEALYLVTRRLWPRGNVVEPVLAGALGNAAGAATNALLFFALKGTPFTLAVAASLISGAVGGWLAHLVGHRLGRSYPNWFRTAPARRSG